MKKNHLNSWPEVLDEVLRRIRSGVWAQGDLIPNEADLAIEFGCARSTVNRALRTAAESGLLERKRKAGTRVAAQPIHRAVLRIPLLRKEIEDQGKTFSYSLLSRKNKMPAAQTRVAMKLSQETKALHIQGVYQANGKPYVYEDRWINCESVPAAIEADFDITNPNEWLLANAPFTAGDMNFSAINANATLAKNLDTEIGTAIFAVRRRTWRENESITLTQLYYAPNHSVHFSI